MKRQGNLPKRRRNLSSFKDASNDNGRLQVVLTAAAPRPQCSVFTQEYGTFCISATDQFKPDVKTLSEVQSRCNEWHETPLFRGANTMGGLHAHLARLVNHTTESSIPDFIKQSERIFQELITLTREASGSSAINNDSTWTREYAQNFNRQLEELERVYGANVIQNSTDNLLNVTLTYQDKAKRVHKVNLVMNPETFPQSPPTCSCDLPMKWQPSWQSVVVNNEESQPRKKFKGDSSRKEADKVDEKSINDYGHLSRLYADFVQHVDKYQALWNELDDLDANTWILEPFSHPPPSRKFLKRRIVVVEGTSVVVSLDANMPRGPPSNVRWIGSEKFAFQDKLQNYMASTDDLDAGWSMQCSFRENLQRGLGIKLPLPPSARSSTIQDTSLECGICYTHDLPTENGLREFPQIVCDNEPCKRFYHETCLGDWLFSLPSSRKSFDRIIGTCPYCSEPISATIKQGRY